ncbi:MAG: PHP domain-containing protein [Oscillospiraceae bacterium]|nr:PHP domain-containing protein [Oscillospiraceae bacterium]
MNSYRYELHCHTSEGSKCSSMSAKDVAEFYHRMGYSGICVTDHFTGNGTAPNRMLWENRIEHFHKIYLKAKSAGERLGLSVFFGLEYSIAPNIKQMSKITGNDFLILNCSKEWLKDNKEAFGLRPTELFGRIREAGGFIIHAHPFLEEPWIESIRLYPRCVDAVEVQNAHCSNSANSNALAYARMYGLLETAGSDSHSTQEQVLTGLETDAPCLTPAALIAAIKEQRTRVFAIKARCQ